MSTRNDFFKDHKHSKNIELVPVNYLRLDDLMLVSISEQDEHLSYFTDSNSGIITNITVNFQKLEIFHCITVY